MAIGLNNLHPTEGSTHKKKRVGRGPGSGLGKTAGRGNKGQKSRSGYSSKVGFEGGQMPLQRRLPKRGFTNIFKKQWTEITLAALDAAFADNDDVTPDVMHARGVIAKGKRDVVVLGTGEINKPLRVSAHRFTKSAREKIEGAGGTATLIESRKKKADESAPDEGQEQ
ncbi:MAG TPA: 50S ribosomal protein L15 [Pyrinomonadaceae bacterium]